ncbi:MAG: RNA polymerase factor sigma-54 [Endomicrobiales bacterium]
MRNAYAQRQSMRQNPAFRARLAGLLEMSGGEYAGLIREIESDPLFLRLKYGENAAERAIRSRRPRQADLSRRYFELKEDLAAATGGGAEVEQLLADKQQLVRTIRKIGEERFKRYFIFNEDGLSLAVLADRCGLSPEEAKEILCLVNTVDLHGEFFMPPAALPENNLSYHKIAVLSRAPGGIAVQFTSAHWARGLYEVDHGQIGRMAAAGRFSESEKKRLPELLKKMELVNIRKSLTHAVLEKIIEKQGPYLHSRGKREPAPFMQAELARDMGVHPSTISRSLAGRSVETPWGEEKPLKGFFRPPLEAQREAILRHIKDIVRDEKSKMRKGVLKRPLSDKAIAELLCRTCAPVISPRTVAKYRALLNLPGAFHRAPR